jgi:hypothetical protein
MKEIPAAKSYHGTMFFFVKGDETTMDEDEIKSKVRAAAKKVMEDWTMMRLPGRITRPCDEGLCEEIRS